MVAEVSPKNGYRHGVSMEFADRAAYAAYNAHPTHVAFVRDRWVPEVTDFLEIDFAARPRLRGSALRAGWRPNPAIARPRSRR